MNFIFKNYSINLNNTFDFEIKNLILIKLKLSNVNYINFKNNIYYYFFVIKLGEQHE